jgi:hypothetical protein
LRGIWERAREARPYGIMNLCIDRVLPIPLFQEFH